MERISNGAFEDDLGYLIDVGTQVGFKEVFCNWCERDKECPSYIVLDLPHYGHMVEMTEIRFLSGDWSNYEIIDPKRTLLVEPWKIGAI